MATDDDPEPTLPLWYMHALTGRGAWAEQLDGDSTPDAELVGLVADRIEAADKDARAIDLFRWRELLREAIVGMASLKRRLEVTGRTV